MDIKTILLTGKPGSGKGTQAKRLADARGWMHFSTGDRFRKLREEESALGTSVRSAYDSGKLLPDWFATYLFEETILELGAHDGIVCDGYPRSYAQAEMFGDIASWLERPYMAIDLDVPDDEVIKRMISRNEVEARPDSATREQLQVRLDTYREHTEPMLDFFRAQNMFTQIDGTGTPDEVAAAINALLIYT